MNTKTRKLVVTGLLVALEAILVFTPVGIIRLLPVSATTMHIPVIIGAVLEGPLVGGILGLIFGLLSMLNAVVAPNLMSPIFLNPLVAVLPRILIGIGTGYLFRAFVKLDSMEHKSKSCRPVSGAVYVLSALALSLGAYYYVGLFAAKIEGISETVKAVLSILPAALILALAAVFFKRFQTGDKRDIGAAVSAVAGSLINTTGVLGMIALMEAQNFIVAVPNAAQGLGIVYSGIILTNSIPEAILACAVTILVYKALKVARDRKKPQNGNIQQYGNKRG